MSRTTHGYVDGEPRLHRFDCRVFCSFGRKLRRRFQRKQQHHNNTTRAARLWSPLECVIALNLVFCVVG